MVFFVLIINSTFVFLETTTVHFVCTNDAIKRNKTVTDSEYNTLVDDGHQRKRMCRASYMHNSEDVVMSATDTFICEYSLVEYQCSSSKSPTNHCVIESVNDDEMLDIIPFEKTMYTSDKKGKNVVSLFNNVENRIQKTVDADNCCLMKKGQAFSKKIETVCFEIFAIIVFLRLGFRIKLLPCSGYIFLYMFFFCRGCERLYGFG